MNTTTSTTNHTQAGHTVLQAHAEAVGTKAAGIIHFGRVSGLRINLSEYNDWILNLSQQVSLTARTKQEMLDLQNDLKVVTAASGYSQEDIQTIHAQIARLGSMLPLLQRIDAAAVDSVPALGNAYKEVIDALRIRDLSPRHAFRTATRKLEHKREADAVNYLIRMVVDEGASQERHIVREIKNAAGKVLEYQTVARIVYEETTDAYGNVVANISPVITVNEPFVIEACSLIQAAFDKERYGASGARFKTAMSHLVDKLQSIPLATRGFVYYCPMSKAPLVSLCRSLADLVNFLYKEGADGGCQFFAVPLLSTDETQEEVIKAANIHLQTRLAETIGEIQALRKQRSELPPDMDPNERAVVTQDLQAQERKLRLEVAEVQANVRLCLEELTSQKQVLEMGSKVLLKQYKDLLGV